MPNNNNNQRATEAANIADGIRPLLAGHTPDVQGAVLMHLLAIFLAGHHPDMRETILRMHVGFVREMIPTAEAELFDGCELPEGWPKRK